MRACQFNSISDVYTLSMHCALNQSPVIYEVQNSSLPFHEEDILWAVKSSNYATSVLQLHNFCYISWNIYYFKIFFNWTQLYSSYFLKKSIVYFCKLIFLTYKRLKNNLDKVLLNPQKKWKLRYTYFGKATFPETLKSAEQFSWEQNLAKTNYKRQIYKKHFSVLCIF